ncbi:hypothetical protein HNQ56_003758 [Anaerotaenia torta]|uniref:HNH endonuclease n=1 Tax=Anaerotaenia torta TaxID=433293 RepID=UPI003D1D9AB1
MRRKLTRAERQQVYNKTSGHCAYCGCEIPFKGFNADHVECLAWNGVEADNINNMLPSCRSCNNYKHTMQLETFRKELSKIPGRLQRDINTYGIAKRYGLVQEDVKPVEFYFERIGIKLD